MLGSWNADQDPESNKYIYKFAKKYGMTLYSGRRVQYLIKDRMPKDVGNKWVKEDLGNSIWGEGLIETLYARISAIHSGKLLKESDFHAMLLALDAATNRSWFPRFDKVAPTIYEDHWRSKPDKARVLSDNKNADRISRELFTRGNFFGKQLRKFNE